MLRSDRIIKRAFDLVVAVISLVSLGWLMVLLYIAATIDTRQNGVFTQRRVGQYGKLFTIFKFRSMREFTKLGESTNETDKKQVTWFGKFLRRSKLDELPQIINVLLGQMSFVGPRPDVPGFADLLTGRDRIILEVKPGMTGPATLYFRDEESILLHHPDPETYNREVIYPQKVKINRDYVEDYSLWVDLRCIFQTAFNIIDCCLPQR